MKKKTLFTLLGIGTAIGLVIALTTQVALSLTSDAKFCVVCHEMDPMVISFKQDVHGGAGKHAFEAECVDCHMPHDHNILNYIYTKAKNGLVEGKIHFFGDPNEIDWAKKREDRMNLPIYDDGCMRCHTTLFENELLPKQVKKMHKKYQKVKAEGKPIKCASCHIDVGHKELRTYLNYYKPEYPIYKEKMETMKEKTIKKFSKYGIDTEIKKSESKEEDKNASK